MNCIHFLDVIEMTEPAAELLFFLSTRGGPCQHGFMCGCKQWSNDINESN